MKAPLKRFRDIGLVISLVLALGAAAPVEVTVPATTDTVDGINSFSVDLMRQVYERSSGANLMMSPQSAYHALAATYMASGGTTKKELAQVFHFPEDARQLADEIGTVRRKLLATAESGDVELSIANAVWLDGTYATFRDSYLDTLKNDFGAAIFNSRFSDAETSARLVNAWIAEQTNNRLGGNFGPENFESKSGGGLIDEPALQFINAVYMDADWGAGFNPEETKSRTFHSDADQEVDVPMMHQFSVLEYSETDLVQYLQIPYKGGDLSMRLLLPREDYSLKNLMEQLTPEMIGGDLSCTLLQNGEGAHSQWWPLKELYNVDVQLPKFHVSQKLNLKKQLQPMGVTDVFDSAKANLKKMIHPTINAYNVYVRSVDQEAWIDVNEEGTEAAAYTAVMHYSIGCSASPGMPEASFHADRPFLYFIMHEPTQSILFSGWIVNPLQTE